MRSCRTSLLTCRGRNLRGPYDTTATWTDWSAAAAQHTQIARVMTQVITQQAGGGAWSEPRTLLSQEMPLGGVPKVVANKLVVLSSGAWLLPFWMQKSIRVCETKKESNTAGVLRSIDAGATWQAHGQIRLDYPTHWIIEGCAQRSMPFEARTRLWSQIRIVWQRGCVTSIITYSFLATPSHTHHLAALVMVRSTPRQRVDSSLCHPPRRYEAACQSDPALARPAHRVIERRRAKQMVACSSVTCGIPTARGGCSPV
jgi:hypothetical protein